MLIETFLYLSIPNDGAGIVGINYAPTLLPTYEIATFLFRARAFVTSQD